MKASSLVPEIIIHNLLIWHLSKLLLNKSIFFPDFFCLSNVQKLDIEKTVEENRGMNSGLEPTVGQCEHKV